MQSTSTRGKKETAHQGPPATFTSIRKRDGRFVDFDADKITRAILKAGRATGELSEDIARKLAIRVLGLTQVMAQTQLTHQPLSADLPFQEDREGVHPLPRPAREDQGDDQQGRRRPDR